MLRGFIEIPRILYLRARFNFAQPCSVSGGSHGGGTDGLVSDASSKIMPHVALLGGPAAAASTPVEFRQRGRCFGDVRFEFGEAGPLLLDHGGRGAADELLIG